MKRVSLIATPSVLFFLFFLLISSLASGQTAQEWFKKGTSFKTAKNYPEAITAFKKATDLKKDYWEAWQQLAWSYNESSEYVKAEEAGKQAVKFKSNYAEGWMELGYAQRKQLKFTDAITSITNALRYKDNYMMATREMGYIYKDQKNYDKALEYYLRALAIEPGNAETNYQVGWVNNYKAKYTDAIPYLRSANRAKKDYYQALQELGYAFYKTAQYDSAETNYKKSIAAKPDYAAAYRGLGDVYRLGKKPARVDDAMKQYKSALQYDSTNMGANFGLGWCYNEQKTYVLATNYLEKAAKLSPSDANVLSELGYSYYARGLYNDAIAKFKLGIQSNAGHKLCHYYAGLCYVAMKDRTNAMSMYEKLKALDASIAQKLMDGINKM